MKPSRKRLFFGRWALIGMAIGVAGLLCRGSEDAKDLPDVAPGASSPLFFERDVLPILKQNCLACHSKSKAKGGLNLETVASIKAGGDSGSALMIGKGSESLLVKVASRQAEPFMPPTDNSVGAKALTAEEVELLKLWIDQGAQSQPNIAAAPSWQPLPGQVNPILAVAVSSDGQFAACNRGNRIFIYNLVTGRLWGELTDSGLASEVAAAAGGIAHRDLVQSLAFSKAGQLASSGFRTVKLWRRAQPGPNERYVGLGVSPIAIALSRDGSKAIALEKEGTAIVWQTEGQKLLYRYEKVAPGARKAEFIAGTDLFVIAGGGRAEVQIGSSTDGAIRTVAVPGPVKDFALVNEGRQLATASEGVIWFWGIESAGVALEKPVMELTAQSPIVAVASDAAGGKWLASAGDDGAVQIWSVADGKQASSWKSEDVLKELRFSASGQQLITLTGGGTIKIWDVQDGSIVAELNSAAQLQRTLESAERDGVVAARVLEHREKKLKEAEKIWHENAAATRSAGGEIANATSTVEEKLRLWEQALQRLRSAEAELAREQSEGKDEAAAAGGEKTKGMLKAAADAFQKAKENADEAAADVAEAKRKKALVEQNVEMAIRSGANAAEMYLQEQSANAESASSLKKVQERLELAKKMASEHRNPFTAFAIENQGETLVAVCESGLVQVWHLPSRQLLEVIEIGEGGVGAICFNSRGSFLLGTGTEISGWNVSRSWILERTIGGADQPEIFIDRVISLAFSPDGQTLATGGGEPSRTGELKLWDAVNGKMIRSIADPHSDTVFSVAFSPDGRYLATGGADRFVKVFRVETGEPFRSLEGHAHHVLDVAWQADMLTIASAGADNTLKLWEFESGGQQKTIGAYEGEVTSVAFLGSSNAVVSGAGDGSVRVGDRRLRSGGGFIYAMDISPDGRMIVAGGDESVLRVWEDAKEEPRYVFGMDTLGKTDVAAQQGLD